MITGQLVMPETIPGSYWVRVVGHGIIPDGVRFLVVRKRGDGWLLAWRDGIRSGVARTGTLLREEQVERI